MTYSSPSLLVPRCIPVGTFSLSFAIFSEYFFDNSIKIERHLLIKDNVTTYKPLIRTIDFFFFTSSKSSANIFFDAPVLPSMESIANRINIETSLELSNDILLIEFGMYKNDLFKTISSILPIKISIFSY